MSEIDTRLAYVPRDERDTALVRRVIELTVDRWPHHDDEKAVNTTARVREYLGDGLFALKVSRTDGSKFDAFKIFSDGGTWQTTEYGTAWVQVNDDGTLTVAYELDHDALGGAQLAEYPPYIVPHPFIPYIPADTEEELVSVAELAEAHHIPYQTAVSARRSGKLAARRVGRNFATTRVEFARWMENR